MPQASTELQKKIIDRFGELYDTPVVAALRRKGYVLNSDWTWTHSTVKRLNDMAVDDWLCLLFLQQEWDYGGLNVGEEASQNQDSIKSGESPPEL